jgi:flagellar basal body-associated protein FliL
LAKKKQVIPVGMEETRALYGLDQDKGKSRRGVLPPDTARLRRKTGPAPLSRGMRRLTWVLTGIVCGLALVILAGTLYAVFRDSGGVSPESTQDGISATGGDSGAGELEGQSPGNAVFTGIGRLRIAAEDLPGAAPRAVVVSVVFPYPPEDRPFTEELAGKVPLFRRIIRDYFGALSGEELNPLDEQRAKSELLRRFNAELQLGKIELLLFNELMILE